MAERYRAVVVGLGFIGAADPVSGDAIGQRVQDLRGTHAQALAAHPRVTLVAGSSRDLGRRGRFVERSGVRNTYESWEQMLDRERPDIVSVAVNSPHELTTACARAGVRCVFCEKPLATSLRDADAMVDACAAGGTLLVVNHTRRWEPAFTAAAALVREGALGRLHHALVRWPAGRLGNVGTHIFDALDMLLGREAVEVRGELDDTGRPDCRGSRFHDPGGWGTVRYAGGLKAFVDASESIDAPVPLSFLVTGSLGELRIDGRVGSIRPWRGEAAPIPQGDDSRTPMDLAVEEIVRCLDSGSPSSSPGTAARRALEVVMGFHASARRSAPVPLPLRGDDRDLAVSIG